MPWSTRQRDSFAGLSGLGRCWASPPRPHCLRRRLCRGGGAAIYLARLPPLAPIVGELAMTVLFYAPGALVVGWLHHRLVGPLAEAMSDAAVR